MWDVRDNRVVSKRVQLGSMNLRRGDRRLVQTIRVQRQLSRVKVRETVRVTHSSGRQKLLQVAHIVATVEDSSGECESKLKCGVGERRKSGESGVPM